MRMHRSRQTSTWLALLLVALAAIVPVIHHHPLAGASSDSTSILSSDLCVLCVTGGNTADLALTATALVLTLLFALATIEVAAPVSASVRIRAARAPPAR